MFRRVVVRLCALSLFTGGCAGSDTEPTRTTTSARVSIVDPAAGNTLTRGTPFKISFTVEFAENAFTLYTIGFVRDDGVYSPPFACGGAGTSGGAHLGAGQVEVSGVVGPLPVGGGGRTESERMGAILFEFAKGHRVNALLLLKRLPEPPSGPAAGCAPLGTFVPLFNPTEGTVFPENADQRVDMPLNWFVQP